MNKWQTIETAPKDGTVILGFVPHDCGGYILSLCYTGYERWSGTVDFNDFYPTHWMPLPNPPEDIS